LKKRKINLQQLVFHLFLPFFNTKKRFVKSEKKSKKYRFFELFHSLIRKTIYKKTLHLQLTSSKNYEVKK